MPRSRKRSWREIAAVAIGWPLSSRASGNGSVPERAGTPTSDRRPPAARAREVTREEFELQVLEERLRTRDYTGQYGSDVGQASFGWYSAMQAELGGVVAYTRFDGSEVEVTCVSDNPLDHGTGWRDIEARGPVWRFAGTVSLGSSPLRLLR